MLRLDCCKDGMEVISPQPGYMHGYTWPLLFLITLLHIPSLYCSLTLFSEDKKMCVSQIPMPTNLSLRQCVTSTGAYKGYQRAAKGQRHNQAKNYQRQSTTGGNHAPRSRQNPSKHNKLEQRTTGSYRLSPRQYSHTTTTLRCIISTAGYPLLSPR